jgi:predicted aspartyl protease
MPEYDSEGFDPPAPVAHVTLRDLATGMSSFDVPMLIDTGADVTLLPRERIERMGVTPDEDVLYEIQGYDGQAKMADMVQLELIFLGRKFKGQFLLIDRPMGILGRNILNDLHIVLDGPRGEWSE